MEITTRDPGAELGELLHGWRPSKPLRGDYRPEFRLYECPRGSRALVAIGQIEPQPQTQAGADPQAPAGGPFFLILRDPVAIAAAEKRLTSAGAQACAAILNSWSSPDTASAYIDTAPAHARELQNIFLDLLHAEHLRQLAG